MQAYVKTSHPIHKNARENSQEDNMGFQNIMKKNIAENDAINRLKIKSYLIMNVLYEGSTYQPAYQLDSTVFFSQNKSAKTGLSAGFNTSRIGPSVQRRCLSNSCQNTPACKVE